MASSSAIHVSAGDLRVVILHDRVRPAAGRRVRYAKEQAR